jgi:hypothetical protein
LYQEVGNVRFGVPVQLVQGDDDITVGQVADATHLLMHRPSSKPALVVQFDDFF